MTTEISIPTPSDFSFRRTIISHGWCELWPFSIDRDKWELRRVIDLGSRPPVSVSMSAQKRTVKVTAPRKLTKSDLAQVVRDVRHILRLDDDLDAFYAAMTADREFLWIADQGAGRMLRSPTVFEDLVKMICTTNCSWALTEKMVSGLVVNLGRAGSDGRCTFPTPQAMALMPTSFFSNEVRCGYRAPYLKELADRVASGELDVESWLHSPISTKDLIKEMKGVKGVGDYAAENLLKLVGRYDGLALDSWTRAKFFHVRNNGRKATDKKIARYYARFKEWRGLALWCDMTRDWMD
jgi:3-methyladenine DNA glycosylase/8-oxoguanine DNA glycosylase